ncbi:Odorant receptor 2 [Cephus cinctus]|uniref:Odorant receptor n=1 Tax=Cephus cinctus TaxID=211228 RepID=A0A3L9LTU9_CEPCN|nr:odorant receptor 4 [Cephus cinctus]XP_015589020.1 odorant receptor 4 [Cephus cinctus]XP_015589022.1 odorant receptor 4 [Cephus cinctus]RLZ02162.1 Odorant receptor 2 [Cephus cinctus]
MVGIESCKRILSTEDKVQTEQNKNYKSDIEYALKLNRWLLNPISIWPLSSHVSTLTKIQFKFIRTCCWVFLAFLIIPTRLHTIFAKTDRAVKLKMIGPLGFCVMVIVKYFVFVVRAKNIKICVDHVVVDWRNVNTTEDREIMIDSARIARLFTAASALFMYGGGVFYTSVLPLTASKSLSNDNVTIRVLHPFYFFTYDPQTTPMYELVFLVHTLSDVVMYSTTSGVCSLAVVFAMHVDGQCQVLMRLLNDFVDGNREKSSTLHQRLANVVVRHLRILRLISTMENIFNEIFLVEVVGCTFILCFLGYYCMTDLTESETFGLIAYFLLLISLTFNVFAFCYIGELITSQCMRIGQAAYLTEWYRLGGKNASNLIILIIISNRPVLLTAGSMMILSYNSFIQVIKASLAYLNILRQVTM